MADRCRKHIERAMETWMKYIQYLSFDLFLLPYSGPNTTRARTNCSLKGLKPWRPSRQKPLTSTPCTMCLGVFVDALLAFLIFFWRICSRGILLLWILKSFFHIFHVFHLSTRWLWANVATSWWHLLHLDCHHLGMDGTASKVLQRAKPWCPLCEKRDWDKLCGRLGQIWEKHGKTMELTRPREYNKQDCANRDIGHPPTHTQNPAWVWGYVYTDTWFWFEALVFWFRV